MRTIKNYTMAEAIDMPRLSDTMTEGVVAAWHKNVGDSVKKGDILAEIETDKATQELESYKDGILLFRGAENGEKLQVNDLLAIIGKEGEDVSSIVATYQTGPATTDEKTVAVKQPETKAEPVTVPANPQPTKQAAAIDLAAIEEVVLMPRLSDTMTEGVIASWHKKVGGSVKKGDVLADIETDKATMELESYKNGTLLYLGANEGEKIVVNDLLCIIGDKDFAIDAIVSAAKGGSGNAAPSPPVTEAVVSDEVPNVKAPVSQPEVEESVVENEGRILASPLAKKLAEEKGIDLKYVKGSADNGRIVKTDVENYKPVQQQAAAVQTTVSATPVEQTTVKSAAIKTPVVQVPAGQVSFDEVPVSQMRKIIAKRLAESKFSAPHFYLTMAVDMDNAVAGRAKMNELSPVKISFNDLVLKAVAIALKQHPMVNSSWLGDKIRINHHVNIGVAVAVEDGLLVPVVRFADGKSLSQIAVEVKDFAQRAKDKKLQPADWEGNTFTISNLGMFGIDEFTAIINPPDACILAVGGIAKVPVVKNGQVVPGNVMKLTLSCDHRVVDGASGAAFLQTVKGLLEEPLRMLV